ncbi:DNA polymerase III subunit gamma/tau [Candidatus Neomarinimicrobiota bacterium]
MSYQVLSRKWRPQSFQDLIGQQHVAKTLQNAIDRGRVAHAYIFTGARGVGKTTTARLLAKILNCQNVQNQNPCNSCQPCVEITRGNNLDVLEIDGASNRGIEEIRELREAVKYPPTVGNYRIYIIDEVHMLTTPAFNALLKTLEEPPSHVKFILATTDPQKVPQTILSRTQRFDFKRISAREIADHLAKILATEEIESDDAALLHLARMADGSMRDGLSLLDQVIAYQDGKIDEDTIILVFGIVGDTYYISLLNHIAERNRTGILEQVKEMFEGGYDIQEIWQGLNQFLRDAIILAETGDMSLTARANTFDLPDDMDTADLINLLEIGLKTESKLRHSRQPRILVEQQLLKMAELDKVVSIQELLDEMGNVPVKVPISAKPTEHIPERPRQNHTAPAVAATKPVAESRRASDEQDDGQNGTPEDVGVESTAQLKTFNRMPKVDNVKTGNTKVTSGSNSGVALPDDALAQIQERWADIVKLVEEKSARMANLLESTELGELENGELMLQLGVEATINLQAMIDRKGLVETVINELLGFSITILPGIAESVQGDVPGSSKSAANPAVKKLIETFKGEEY